MTGPRPEKIAEVVSEHAQQTALFCWAALHFDEWPVLALMFAIPNGGLRNKITAANLKAEGVRAGVPDIFLPVCRGPWFGLFIEMKKVGGTVEPDQKKWHEWLKAQGYAVAVCVGFAAARDCLIQYLEWR